MPAAFLSQFPGIGAASSNKNCLLLNFVQCCWPSDPVSLSLHLHLLCLHLRFSHPTTFLTSWSVVFLTAVQPLLSDGLFCCLKHLIGGQVYIIRGESLSLSQSEVLSVLNSKPCYTVFMDAVYETQGIFRIKMYNFFKFCSNYFISLYDTCFYKKYFSLGIVGNIHKL